MFDLAVPISDLPSPLREYLAASHATATRRAYACDARAWVAWCETEGREPWPAVPVDVAQWIAVQARAGLRPSTLARRVSALSTLARMDGQPSPGGSPLVTEALRGVRRTHGTAPRRVAPCTVRDLRAIVRDLGECPRDLRDRALVLVAFAGAMRESEVSALHLGDLVVVDQGVDVLLRKSKTDQEGHGRTVPVPFGSVRATCPVRSWLRWREALEGLCSSPSVDLPAFPVLRWMGGRIVLDGPMSPRSVGERVQVLARRAGLPGRWGGHSLRRGLATEASRAGVPDRVIQLATGHKSRASLDPYVEPSRRWDEVAASRVGL